MGLVEVLACGQRTIDRPRRVRGLSEVEPERELAMLTTALHPVGPPCPLMPKRRMANSQGLSAHRPLIGMCVRLDPRLYHTAIA